MRSLAPHKLIGESGVCGPEQPCSHGWQDTDLPMSVAKPKAWELYPVRSVSLQFNDTGTALLGVLTERVSKWAISFWTPITSNRLYFSCVLPPIDIHPRYQTTVSSHDATTVLQMAAMPWPKEKMPQYCKAGINLQLVLSSGFQDLCHLLPHLLHSSWGSA